MGNQHSGSGHHASSAPRHSVDDRVHRDTHVTVQDRSPSVSNASNAAQRRGSQQQQHGSSASLPRSLARRPVASPHSKSPTLHFSETASGVTAATAAPSGRLGSHAPSMSSLTTAAAVNRQLASSSPEHQTLRDERQEEEEGEMEAGMMEGNDDCSPHSISRAPSSMRIPNALHTSADEMPSCLTSEAGTLTIPMGSNVAGQHMLNIVPVTSTTTSATTTATTSAAKPIAGNSNRRASRDGGNAASPPAASSGASAGVKPQSFTHPSHSPTQPTEEPPLPLIVRSSRQTSISAARAVGAEDKSTKSRAQSPSPEARPPTLGARKEDGSRSASKRFKTQKDKGGSNNSAVADDLDIGTAARPSKHASGVVGALFHRKSDKLLFRKSSSSSSSAAARKGEVKRAAKADKSPSPTRLSSADRGADATDRQTLITAARPVKSEQVNTSAVRVGGRAECISKDGDATPSVLSDPILDEDDNAPAAAAAREKCGSPFPSAREDDVDETAGDGDGVDVAVEERDATTPTDEMLLPHASASTPSSSKAAVTPQGRPRTDRRDGSESHKSEEEHEEGEEDSHSTASTDTNSAPILPPPPTVSFAEAMWGTKAAALIALNDHHSNKSANGNDSSIEGADSLAGGVTIGASVVFSASGPSSGPISSPIYSPGGFLSRSGRASGGGGGVLCGATTVTDTTARVSPRSPYMSSLPAVTGATLSGDGWSATRTPVSELDVKMTKRRKTASQSAIIAAWNRMGARSGSLAAPPATVQPTNVGKANSNGSSSNNNTNSHNSSLGDATAGSGPTAAAAAAVVGSAADSTATTAGAVGSVSASKQEGANDINSEAVHFEMSSAHASDSKANAVVAAASSNAHASDAKRNPVVAPVRRRSVLTRYRGHPALFPPPPPPPSKVTQEEKKDDTEHHSQTPTPLPPPPSSPTATTTAAAAAAAAEIGSHEAATTLAAPSPTFNESAHAPLLEREKARDAVLSGLERDYGTDGGPDVPVPYGTTYTLPTFDTYDEAFAKSSAELSGAAAAGVQISPTQFTHANEHRSDVSALARHEDARHEAGAVQAALPSRVFAIPSVHVEDNAAARSHNTATTVTASTVVHPRGLSDCVDVVDGSESATSATMCIQPTMEEEAEDLDDANHDHHLHPIYTTQHQSLNSVFPYVNMAPDLESEEGGAASSSVHRLVLQQDADATSLRFGRAPSQLSSELLSRQSTAVVGGDGFTTTRTRAATITVATLKPHSVTRHCSLLDLSPLADDMASPRERSSRLQAKQDSCEQQQQKQQINTSLGLLWSDSPSPGSSEVAASPLSRHSHQNHFTEPKTLPLDSQERELHEKEEQEEGEEGDMVGATHRLRCRQRGKDGEGMEVVDGEELGLNNSRNSFDAASTPLLPGRLRQPTYAELPSAGSDADNHADHNSNNNDSTSNASYPRHHLHLVSPPTFVTASRSGSIGSTGPVTAAAAATAVSGVVQSSSTQPKRALTHQQQQQQQSQASSSFTTSARHMPYWRERLTPVLHAQPSSPRSVSATRDDLCTASTTSNRHLSHYNNPNGGDESGGYHSSPAGSGLRRRRLSTASQGPPPLARHPSSSSCPPQQLQRELSSSGVQWREVSLFTSAVGTPSVGADIGMSSREEEEEEGLRREGPLQRRGYTRGDGGDDDDEEEEEVRSGKYGSAARRRAALQRRSRRPHGHRAEGDDGVGAPRRGDEPYDPWGRSISSPLLWGAESPRLRQRAHVRKNNKNVDEDEEVEEDTPGQMTYYGDKRDSNELHRTAPYHRPHRVPSSQLPYSHISGSEDDAGQHANCGGHGHHHHRFFSPRGVPVLYGASPPQDSSLPCTPPEEVSRRTRNARSLFPSGGDGDGDVAAFLSSSMSDLDIPHTRTSTTSFAENASRLPLTRYEPPMPSNRNTFTAFVPLSDIPSSHLLASATAIFRGGYPYGEDSGASSKPIPGAAAANDSGEAAITATTTTIGNGFSMGDTPVTVDTLLVTGYSPAGVPHPVSGLTGCGAGGAAVNGCQLNSPLFSSVSTAPTNRISSGCSPVQGMLSPLAGIAPKHPLHPKHSRSHSRSSSNNNNNNNSSSSSHPNDHANGGESGGGGAAAAAGVAGGEDGQCAPLHGVTPFLHACDGEERPIALPRQSPSTTTARDAAAQVALPLKRKNGPKMAAPAAAAATAAVSQKPMSSTSTLLSSVNCAAAEHLPTTEDTTTPQQQQQHSPWSVQSAPAGVAEVVARTGFTHLSSWENELHHDMRELVLTPTLAAVSRSNGPSARIEVAPLATSATATTPKSVFASFTSALTSVVGADRSRKSSGFVSSNEGADFNGGVNAASAVGGTLFIERQDTTPLFSGAGSAGSDGGSIHRHASAKVLRSSQSPRPLPSALARTNSEPILSFPPHHSAALYPNQSQEQPWWNRPRLARSEDNDFLVEQLAAASPAGGPGRVIGSPRSAPPSPPELQTTGVQQQQEAEREEGNSHYRHRRSNGSSDTNSNHNYDNLGGDAVAGGGVEAVAEPQHAIMPHNASETFFLVRNEDDRLREREHDDSNDPSPLTMARSLNSDEATAHEPGHHDDLHGSDNDEEGRLVDACVQTASWHPCSPHSSSVSHDTRLLSSRTSAGLERTFSQTRDADPKLISTAALAMVVVPPTSSFLDEAHRDVNTPERQGDQQHGKGERESSTAAALAFDASLATLVDAEAFTRACIRESAEEVLETWRSIWAALQQAASMTSPMLLSATLAPLSSYVAGRRTLGREEGEEGGRNAQPVTSPSSPTPSDVVTRFASVAHSPTNTAPLLSVPPLRSIMAAAAAAVRNSTDDATATTTVSPTAQGEGEGEEEGDGESEGRGVMAAAASPFRMSAPLGDNKDELSVVEQTAASRESATRQRCLLSPTDADANAAGATAVMTTAEEKSNATSVQEDSVDAVSAANADAGRTQNSSTEAVELSPLHGDGTSRNASMTVTATAPNAPPPLPGEHEAPSYFLFGPSTTTGLTQNNTLSLRTDDEEAEGREENENLWSATAPAHNTAAPSRRLSSSDGTSQVAVPVAELQQQQPPEIVDDVVNGGARASFVETGVHAGTREQTRSSVALCAKAALPPPTPSPPSSSLQYIALAATSLNTRDGSPDPSPSRSPPLAFRDDAANPSSSIMNHYTRRGSDAVAAATATPTTITTAAVPLLLPPSSPPHRNDEADGRRRSNADGVDPARHASPSPRSRSLQASDFSPSQQRTLSAKRRPSVGQVVCRWCNAPYTSAVICPVARRTHQLLREERKKEKMAKRQAQALLCVGRVAEAVTLLKEVGLYVP